MEKIKVLLVEDEPTLAMIIKDTLDGNEFDITLDAAECHQNKRRDAVCAFYWRRMSGPFPGR